MFVEHTFMTALFAGLSFWLVYKKEWLWLGVACIVQAPFWAGTFAINLFNADMPATSNLILHVLAACVLVSLSEKLNDEGRNAIVAMMLCIVLLVQSTVDVAHLVTRFDGYSIIQQVVSAWAVLLLAGRGYVERACRGSRYGLHSSDTHSAGGRVV
jgi:hypothetical protein